MTRSDLNLVYILHPNSYIKVLYSDRVPHITLSNIELYKFHHKLVSNSNNFLLRIFYPHFLMNFDFGISNYFWWSEVIPICQWMSCLILHLLGIIIVLSSRLTSCYQIYLLLILYHNLSEADLWKQDLVSDFRKMLNKASKVSLGY